MSQNKNKNDLQNNIENSNTERYTETLSLDAKTTKMLFGDYDNYISKIENELEIDVVLRDDSIKIYGEERKVKRAKRLLTDLVFASSEGNIDIQKINYGIELSKEDSSHTLKDLDDDIICHTVMGKPVKPKTVGQKEYVQAIKDNMIVFGTGPAGTGKTYLAMAMAITAFKNEEVSRIILTRPAIEAGEKLGFLPGDLQSKVDPYLRPLYDALHQIMGTDSFNKNMEKGLIEVAPLAYMRGRTLDNAFIILDEAQNTTPPQMKMFLTRLGFGSKCVITGDQTQKDLSYETKSGLDEALKILNNIEGIKSIKLTSKDVVRHPLVMQIIKAYEKHESKEQQYKNSNKNAKPKH